MFVLMLKFLADKVVGRSRWVYPEDIEMWK